MSRGPGTVQRFITEHLDRIARSGDRDEELLVPVAVLTEFYAREHEMAVTPHLRSSFRRAAVRLAEAHIVQMTDVLAPTRKFAGDEFGSLRWLACVYPADRDLTDEMVESAQLATALFLAQ